MEIVIKNGMANVYTPYNPYFVNAIKGIGKATWNREKNVGLSPKQR
jgi:hypothetical protein